VALALSEEPVIVYENDSLKVRKSAVVSRWCCWQSNPS